MPKQAAEPQSTVLSEDEARAGVTGHHVRHVLAFGLLGSILAYALIAIYYGHDWLIATISRTYGQIDPGLVARYAILLVIAVVAAILLNALWDFFAGRSSSTSQRVMRLRVVLQFAAVFFVLGAVYLSTF